MRRVPAAFPAASAAAAIAAATTLLALAPSPAAAQFTPDGGGSTQARRRAAFDSVSGPTLSMQADPAFRGVGAAGGRTTPLVVRIKNRGVATSAEIEVEGVGIGSGLQRTYRRRVDLPGAGAVSRFLLYPSAETYHYGGGYRETFRVHLRAHGRSVWEPVAMSDVEPSPQVGYIGDRVGALNMHAAERAWHKRAGKQRWRNTSEGFQPFLACDAKPEDAPDRAAGYAALDHLVLGEGAERLTEAQWSAIRGWVQSGGSLILLGGDGVATLLASPTARALTPVGAAPRRQVFPAGSLHLPGMVPLPKDATITTHPGGFNLPAGTKPIASVESKARFGGNEGGVFLARRDIGAGTVLYVGFDPTEEPFRSWPDLNQLWTGLLKRATPPIAGDTLRHLATDPTRTLNADFRFESDADRHSAAYREAEAGDPFAVQMPPLRSVVFLFLGYFVLAIPVTFVVLKRTRRMNLAWITGPTLAVGVAGALYLFTFGLSRAPSSRRTAGVLVAGAGHTEARFLGYTELFFSQAGSYDITVPGAERLELHPDGVDYGYYANPNTAMRSLTSEDDGRSVTSPSLPVANLSFRRVYHEQPASLGGTGVRADVAWNPDGTVTYTVHNGTTRTLTDVRLLVDDANDDNAYRQHGAWLRSVPLKKSLPPGQSEHGRAAGNLNSVYENAYYGHSGDTDPIRLFQRVAAGRTALVVARTSGVDLGPNVGRYAGGDRSVLVVVPVPALAVPKGMKSQPPTGTVPPDPSLPGGRPPGFGMPEGGR